MKVMVQLSLDLENPHERLAYDVLTAVPQNGQKEFMVSALLFYTKSPSYLVEVKMQEYLEQLDTLNQVFSSESYLALMERMHEILSVKEDIVSQVSDRIAESLSGLDLSRASKSKAAHGKTVQVAVPDDILSGMKNEFST